MFFLSIVVIFVFLWYSSINAFGLSVATANSIFAVLGVFLWWFGLNQGSKIINNRVYWLSPKRSGSFANFSKVSSGIIWTPKNKINIKDGSLAINKFVYDKTVDDRFSMFLNYQKDETMIQTNTKSMTRGSLIIGQMGAGKTVFLNNILNQKWYTRALIHDVKGDYTSYFYKSSKDIIFNPFDRRGKIWDIFEEARIYPQVIKPFFTNLTKSQSGKETNFFSSSSADRYINIFNDVLRKNLDSKKSWQVFINSVNKFFEDVLNNEKGQKSEKDVVSTMKLTFEFFEYQNYLIQKDIGTFTIDKIVTKKDCKLFLLNNPTYSSYLNPYFSGFLSAYTNIFMIRSKEGTKEYTLFLLDEYLSFLPILDDGTVTSLHTLIRSKGGCLMPAVQYVPAHNKELLQKLMNSVDHLFVFQTADETTASLIKTVIGKCEYEAINKSVNKDGKNETSSTNTADLITDDILKGLGEDFTHLTFIPSKKILYKGYTPMLKLKVKNESFIDFGYKEFLLQKDQ